MKQEWQPCSSSHGSAIGLLTNGQGHVSWLEYTEDGFPSYLYRGSCYCEDREHYKIVGEYGQAFSPKDIARVDDILAELCDE